MTSRTSARAKATSGPVLMTIRSATPAEVDLAVGILGAKVTGGDSEPGKQYQELHTSLPAQPRRLAGGEPPQLVELGSQHELGLL
jgi:hypothetical protein